MHKELQELANKGQFSFAAAVYYDADMPVEDKKRWLLKATLLDGEKESNEARNYYDQLCHVCGDPDCVGDYAHFE